MSTWKLAAKVGMIGLCAVLALGGMQASAAENDYDELANFPGQGIPDSSRGSGAAEQWVTPQQTGLSYLKQAKQWVRTPVLQSVAYNHATQIVSDPSCQRIPQAPGARLFREYRADVTLVDRTAPLDSPRRYGYTASFDTRTVAFGSIPVEATVVLEQPRSAKGVVIPTELTQKQAEYCAGQGSYEIPPPAGSSGKHFMPAEGGGRLRVRIDQVVVDGVNLRLIGKCAADDARLTLSSREYADWDPRIPAEDKPDSTRERARRTPYWAYTSGGLILGSLNIPAFQGCVTSGGDDISALLTATVSGDGNAVQIRTETIEGDLQPGEEVFDMCPFRRGCEDRFPAPELPTEPPS